MKNKIRTDIFYITPEIGDTIIFNPPKYKGLVYGECIGFSEAGLPKVTNIKPYVSSNLEYGIDKNGYYTPKTEFVVKKKGL